MILMTPDLEKLLKKTAQEGTSEDPILAAKFFNPCGLGSWYPVRYFPSTRVCFGYVQLFENEWGDFSLDELEAIKLPYGLEIERDILWRPKPFSEAQIHF